MLNLGLQALLVLSASAAVTPVQQATVRTLRLESARSAVAAMTASDEDAHGAAQKGFDGGGLPVTVRVLEPVDTIPLPGEGEVQPAPRPTPAPTDGSRPPLGDSYHFRGTRTPLGMTFYTPVKDIPGRDGSTTTPGGGGDWKQTAIKALPYVGAAATIAGIFFPPLLFLGGLLLGAWGALKLMSRD